ncbi:MAG: MFS transporter [Candidatus Methanofastidiosa archaeon]|nr:MFS transporter [Candidatus Methanofastidiosa archaeon]
MLADGNARFLMMMTLVHMVNDGFEMVVPTLMPAIAISLDLSYSQIGIVSGSMVLAMGLGQAFIGIGSDVMGHKRHMIIFGVLISSAGFLTMGLAFSYPLLLLAGIFIGFGLSIYHPVSMAIITNRFNNSTGRAVGIHGSGGNMGMFLFPLLAGVLADLIGWRKAIAVFPLIGIAIITAYSISVKEEEIKLGKFEPRKLLVPALAIIIASIGMFNMATRGFFIYFPVTLGDLGFSSSMIGIYFSAFFGIGILGQYIGGYVSDRYDEARSLFALLIVSGTAMYAALQHPQGSTLVIFILISGLTVNMIWPIFFVLYARKTPPNLRGTGFGLFFSVNYLFAASSPLLMGGIGAWYSIRAANLLVIVTAIVGALVILILKRE